MYQKPQYWFAGEALSDRYFYYVYAFVCVYLFVFCVDHNYMLVDPIIIE